MKRIKFISFLAAFFPVAAVAQGVPLYIETDGELDFSGDFLGETQLAELLGGNDAVATFGVPEFVARNGRTGAVQPVWASLQDYELFRTGDGIIEHRHDDLTFDESDAQAPQEDLVFSETEADDLREDLVFTETEERNTGDDMTFGADEALAPPEKFSGPQLNFIQPAHGVWQIALTRSDAVGCPPGISELASAQLGHTGAKDIIFSEPGWVPADLNPDYGRYGWKPKGANGYVSEPYSTGPASVGSGVSLTVNIALTAISEQQIDVWAQVQMDLAPALAVIAGGSTTCIATMTGSYSKD